MLKVLLWMLMGQQCPGGAQCVPIHPPCNENITLQSETAATVPSNRSRIKLGVGEPVTLTLSAAPPAPCSSDGR
jgi:hypothetical protein